MSARRPLTLTGEQLRLVEAALYGEEKEARRAAVAAFRTPEEIHAFVDHFNWDSDIDVLKLALESPHCDRGTALMAYWLTDVFEMAERPKYGGEVWEIAMEIERRYLAGEYRSRRFRFDPHDPADFQGDFHLAIRGATRELPAMMMQATPGEAVDASWEALRGEKTPA